MTLRVRLTLYFTLIVLLPLLVAALTGRFLLIEVVREPALGQSEIALEAITAEVELVRLRAGDLAEDLAAPQRQLGSGLQTRDGRALRTAIDSAAGQRGRADVVLLADPAGRVLASRVRPPELLPGNVAPSLEQLAAAAASGRPLPGVTGEVRRIQDPAGRPLGVALVGRWVDGRLATELSRGLPIELTLLVDDRPVAVAMGQSDAGGAPSRQEDPGRVQVAHFDGWSVSARALRDPTAEAASAITKLTAGLLLAAALSAALLGWLLSKLVVRPVSELAAAAEDVAAGDLDRRIEVTGGGELAVLGNAFNAMTDHLRRQLQALEVSRSEVQVSRDALQRSLQRLGQTLSSTLDLNRTLAAVVDAAMTALTAQRAGLYMLAPGRSSLYLKVGRGLPRAYLERRIVAGEGLVGWVAHTSRSARLPQDAGEVPVPAGEEPQADALVAVPLFSPNSQHVIGVLVLYDRADGAPFSESDLHTIRSFAAQASVAIENVRLHEATQQASITDSLTGLWNLRYFQRRAQEEVERANRFSHQLAMLILDIDHFKAVNDEHGHLVGDQVLVEVSRRVSSQVREVDTLARYGGEEFVLILPETDLEGARRTAERIRTVVAERPIRTDAAAIPVTVSLGVAAFPEHGHTAWDLLRRADQGMYAAKQAGRNRVIIAPVAPQSSPAPPPAAVAEGGG